MNFIISLVAFLIVIQLLGRLILAIITKNSEKYVLTQELKSEISKLNTKDTTDYQYLRKCHEYVTKRYFGNRIKTLTDLGRYSISPFEATEGFLPCTSQNYIMKTMLLESGRFSKKNIRFVVVPFNFIVHQYLDVKLDGNWIHVDPWSHFLGKKLGQRSIFFG